MPSTRSMASFQSLNSFWVSKENCSCIFLPSFRTRPCEERGGGEGGGEGVRGREGGGKRGGGREGDKREGGRGVRGRGKREGGREGVRGRRGRDGKRGVRGRKRIKGRGEEGKLVSLSPELLVWIWSIASLS